MTQPCPPSISPLTTSRFMSSLVDSDNCLSPGAIFRVTLATSLMPRQLFPGRGGWLLRARARNGENECRGGSAVRMPAPSDALLARLLTHGPAGAGRLSRRVRTTVRARPPPTPPFKPLPPDTEARAIDRGSAAQPAGAKRIRPSARQPAWAPPFTARRGRGGRPCTAARSRPTR